ncbi:MAG: tetratricopeptide repeat protein [Candidatus Krumholzibacteriaceae bacterium]|jgi:Flp pilus assembly protein TadD
MKPEERIPPLLIISYLVLVGLQLVPILGGSPGLWGVDQWRYFSGATVLVLFAVGLVPLFRASRAALMRGASRIGGGAVVGRAAAYPLVAHLVYLFFAGVLFWTLRQSTHFLGDGYLWASRMQTRELFSWMRPLSSSMHQVTYYVTNVFWRPAADSPYAAAALVSVASGLIFLVFAYNTACALAADAAGRIFLFVALLSAGTTTLFFGYVEAYAPVAAGVMIFIYFGIRYVQRRERAYFLIVIFLVCLSLHMTLMALLPSLVVTLLTRGETAPVRKKIFAAFSAAVALGLAALWIAQRRTLFAGFFNETFLPFAANAQSTRAAYLMTSPKHFFDVANEILLICPMAVLGLAGFLPPSKSADADDGKVTFFLGSIAFFYVVEYFVFNPVLGAARDWDVLSPMAIPLSLYAALVLLKRFRPIRRELAVFALALLVLHTGPWVAVNSSREKSLNRFADLADNGYWSVYAKAYAYELLAKHALNDNDEPQALRFFSAALKTDPKNRRYRYDLARIYMGRKQYPDAMTLYREILDREPGSLEAMTALGMIYGIEGRDSLSENMYMEAIATDSTSVIAYENLAGLYLKTNRPDRARAMLEKCIRIAPGEPRLYEDMRILYTRIGDLGKAKLYSEKAAALRRERSN